MLDGNYRGFTVATSDPGIAVVTFDQPEHLNGFGQGMKRDFQEVVSQAQLDGDTRVLVVTGTGRAFSAGDDIVSLREGDRHVPTLVPPRPENPRRGQVDQAGLLRVYSQEMVRTLWRLDKVVVAGINGVAVQLGLSVALACDFRIASSDARLGSATLRFGFLPDEGGHWLLLQHLGLARATEFLMRARMVSAQEALELGLVNQVVEPHALLDATMELARELADRPQVALRLLKSALRNALTLPLEAANEDIAHKTAVSDHHPDVREGVQAWRERRPPRFNRWLEAPVGASERLHWLEPGDPAGGPEHEEDG